MIERPPFEVTAVSVGSRTLLRILMVLFFLSGASGLIYEVLWLRLLGLLFGITIYAASTVFASLMSGLALGSFLAGRLVDRARNPLLWYGIAEGLIGAAALTTPAALGAIRWFYQELFTDLHVWLPLLTVVRFLSSFLVLLVPTTLMGATLPIVIKSVLSKSEGLGERAGLLYASNTAGAIAGTLTAGFYLIGQLGITKSIMLAAALNLVVGIAAIALSVLPRSGSSWIGYHLAGAEQALTIRTVPDRTRRLILIVFAISGMVSLAVEVIWFRMLILILDETSYALTIMLAMFLAGIATGSYVIAPLVRRRLERVQILAFIETAIGIAFLLSINAMAWSYAVASWAQPVLKHMSGNEISSVIVASFLAIFPGALLMGLAFPVGLNLWVADDRRQSEGIGEQIGIFYSLNVAGSVLGSLAAGFVLLPKMGSRGSLIAVSVVTLVSGLSLLVASPRVGRLIKVITTVCLVLLSVKMIRSAPRPFDVALKHRYPSERLLWHEEGLQTTVAVTQRSEGTRSMYLDGLVQADDSELVGFHRLLAVLPMLIHHDPKDALNIGLGSGTSAGMLSRYPGINVDVVELSSAVLIGSEWFRHVNYDVLRQPNVHLRLDDGRNYLLLTSRRYDVITGVPVRPFTPGAGSLFSAEFFRMEYRALKDDGVVLQWVRRKNDAEYKMVMRTFLSVFPDATLWNKKILIGAKAPLTLGRAEVEAKLRLPDIHDDLELIGLNNFQSLLSFYTAGPEEMRMYVGGGPILTDDRPLAEYFLSLPKATDEMDRGELTGDVMRHVRQ